MSASWDLADGREVAEFKGKDGVAEAVAFSPDGVYLATGGGNGITVKELATSKEKFSIFSIGLVHSVAFSPDGKLLASGCGYRGDAHGGDVKLWDAVTGKPILTLRGHAKRVTSVVFSADGKQLASASYDGTAKVWDGHIASQEATTLAAPGSRVCVGRGH